MNNSIIKRVKKAYKQTKRAFSGEHKEYLWIYDNFYLIDRHYRAFLKSKNTITAVEKSGCFEIISNFCEERNYKFNDKELYGFLSSLQSSHIFTCKQLYAIPALIAAASIIRIGKACESGEELSVLPNAVNLLRFLGELDSEELFMAAWVPEKILISYEEKYELFAEETKNDYRNAIASFCTSKHISEPDGAKLLAEKAVKEGRSIGSLLFSKRKRESIIYIALVASIILLLFCISFIAIGFWGFLLILPIFETAISLSDFVTSHTLKEIQIPRIKLEKVPDDAKTLVVITSLLFGSNKDKKLFDSIERFYLINRDENVFFGILGDLPDSKKKFTNSDKDTVNYAIEQTEQLNKKYKDRFCLFIRERSENKTDKIFGGRERKRGAVTDLVKFIKGADTIRTYIGGDYIKEIKYIYTLDADTNLSLGGVRELLGVALHPLNLPTIINGRISNGYGIYQPLMRTELASAYKTRFSRLISGVGGADIYESAAFDRYQSIFGSGVFCGKGLFSVNLFDKLVTPKLPDGWILSHDILEGCILRTCFVSDITLTDSTPKNTVSYTNRLHRWIRGDFQNLRFLKGDMLDCLSKSKILANAIRHLTPLSAVFTIVLGGLIIHNQLTAFFLLLMSFIYLLVPCFLSVFTILISGKPFALRRFFSQATTAIAQSISRAFYELFAACHTAYITADAVIRAVWRMQISKKKLLEWVTADESDITDKDSVFYYIRKCFFPALIGALLFLFAPAYPIKLIGFAFFMFPLIANYESKPIGNISSDIVRIKFTDEDKEFLTSHARDMWNYFADNVNKKSHYLPPDNIQLSPAEHVAYRTSPTNIGFYLISCLAAKDFGFIGLEEMIQRLEKSMSVIRQLKKYQGHLYNWYDIKSLEVIGNEYVSTVDSGNFVSILITLRQGLYELEENSRVEKLIEECDNLIKNTDFKVLYNNRRNLFTLGIDGKTQKPDNIYYDLFMSEARLTGYYALASGLVPKKHWRSLGRTLTTSGGYLGMISWSGTAFEYLLPHLFLPIYRNSFVYESLFFAMNEQRRAKYNNMWGISESAFYSFDSDMNYQYKAHGVQKIALKRYNGDEAVLSPYSTYLSLCIFRANALRNLRLFDDKSMYGKYGLYEALDMTPARSKNTSGASANENGVAVRCYMAHHLGMSIIACANACDNNRFVKRFFRDQQMAAAYELLQEKIPVETHLFEDERTRFATDIKLPLPKKYKVITEDQTALQMPSVTCITRDSLSIICSGSGHVQLRSGKYPINDTAFYRYSLKHSLTTFFIDSNEAFGCAPLYREGVYSFEKGGFYACHISSSKQFSGRVKYYIHPKSDAFVVETKADSKHFYSLCLCFEPHIAEPKSFAAHPSFSKLFIEADYDDKDKIIYFSRRPREEDEKQIFIAVALQDTNIKFEFTTRKDTFNAYGLEHTTNIVRAKLENETGPCVNPLCLIKTAPVSGGKAAFLITLATGRREAKANIQKARRQSKEPEVANRILPETERFLQAILFRSRLKQVQDFTGGSINVLWKQGISGDYPIITVFLSAENDRAVLSYLMAFLVLTSVYIRFELVFLIKDQDKYIRPAERSVRTLCEQIGVNTFLDRNGGIFIRTIDSSNEFFINFLKLSSALYIDVLNDIGINQVSSPVLFALPIKTEVNMTNRPVPENAFVVFGGFFTDKGFIVDKKHPLKMPFSYILSGRRFGSVIADSSLCYTFTDNSRERRITPFEGDPYSLSEGERLILQTNGENYDLCAASEEVEYKNGTAVFRGVIDKKDYTLTVFTCADKPLKFIKLKYEGTEKLRTCLITRPIMGSGLEGAFCVQIKKTSVQNNSVLYKNETSADFSESVGFTGVVGSGKIFTDYAALVFEQESGIDDIAAVTSTANECIFFIGSGNSEEESLMLIESISKELCEEELEHAAAFAEALIPPISLKSRSRSSGLLFNSFLPYQAAACRYYARASFYQSGGAYGFRDQLQDCLCLVYSNPQIVKEHIVRACKHQYTEGDVQHWWHPIYQDGMNRGVRTKCTDDYLWLPFVVADYIKKTADYSLLNEEAEYITSPMLDKETERYELPQPSGISESVYKHCLRALSNAERFGSNGLSLIGSCDWNDAFSSVGVLGRGESVFTSFFYILTIRAFLPLINDEEVAAHYKAVADRLLSNIEKNAYYGNWYARAIHDDGTVIGIKGNSECEIDILPQCFAAMVKGGDDRVSGALDFVYEKLFDKKSKILKLFTPPFADGELNVGYIKGYVAGIRENGGQYTHGAIWGAIGFILAGKTEIGLELMHALNPASRCVDFEQAKQYKVEPYVISADIYSAHPHNGRGGWSWYTGAAAWYYKAIIEHVLGISLSNGFAVIDVKPITNYETQISYNDYKLTVIASSEEGSPALDGNPVNLPLEIPSGTHTLTVPVPKILNTE